MTYTLDDFHLTGMTKRTPTNHVYYSFQSIGLGETILWLPSVKYVPFFLEQIHELYFLKNNTTNKKKQIVKKVVKMDNFSL